MCESGARSSAQTQVLLFLNNSSGTTKHFPRYLLMFYIMIACMGVFISLSVYTNVYIELLMHKYLYLLLFFSLFLYLFIYWSAMIEFSCFCFPLRNVFYKSKPDQLKRTLLSFLIFHPCLKAYRH